MVFIFLFSHLIEAVQTSGQLLDLLIYLYTQSWMQLNLGNFLPVKANHQSFSNIFLWTTDSSSSHMKKASDLKCDFKSDFSWLRMWFQMWWYMSCQINKWFPNYFMLVCINKWPVSLDAHWNVKHWPPHARHLQWHCPLDQALYQQANHLGDQHCRPISCQLRLGMAGLDRRGRTDLWSPRCR